MSTSSTSDAPGRRRSRDRLAAFVALTKPRVLELLLVTTAPTMVLAQQGLPGWWMVLATLVGGSLSAGAASAFNMYLDRDIDARMERTAHRPLVTGAVSPREALVFATVLALASTGWFLALVNVLAAALSVSAILCYVVLYSIVLKKRTWQNIVWGGAAGCFPALIAWAAVKETMSWPALVLFLIIFFWTPAHYWPLSLRYAEDYRRVGVPMLGAVKDASHVAVQVTAYAAATVATSLVLIPVATMGPLYTGAASLVGAWFLINAGRLLLETRTAAGRATARPMRVFHASNIYLAVVFVAVGIDPLVTI